jgi:hypothetical protein
MKCSGLEFDSVEMGAGREEGTGGAERGLVSWWRLLLGKGSTARGWRVMESRLRRTEGWKVKGIFINT